MRAGEQAMDPVTKPRVLHILNELRPSGAEVMLRIAAQHWFSAGRPHAILATAEHEGPYADQLREAGYQIYHIPFSKTLRFFTAVYRLIREGRFDAVHIHTERANVLYATVARLAGVRRLIHTIHATFTFTGGLRHVRKCMRAGLRWLGVCQVSVSLSVLENEIQRFSNPTIVIPNWYDDRSFRLPTREQKRAARAAYEIDDDRPVIATLGNCAPVKNHGSVLHALQILLGKNPGWFYLHAGGEDMERTEHAFAVELGVADRCAFLGYSLNPLWVLWAADVFVMPSFQEGFGISAIEAAATGLPLVLTDVPGLRDFRMAIPDAFWVQPEPAALASAIETAHQRFRSGSAANASSAQDRFGIKAGARAYEGLYAGIRSAGAAPRMFCRQKRTNRHVSTFRIRPADKLNIRREPRCEQSQS